MESPLSLPDHRDLSPNLLRFVADHFVTHENVSRARHLESQFKKDVADSNTSLTNLQNSLNKLVVSWISHSVSAQNGLRRLNLKLQNLNPDSARYGICSMIMGKILGEFSQLVKEVCRMESVRSYAETTLRLEGLVGDLEDAVFWIMNQHSRTMFSNNFSNPSNSSAKQERLLQAVNIMNNIEEVLINIKKNRPQWCHLVKSVDTRLDEILAILRPQIVADYRAIIASLGWPPNLLISKTECNQTSELPNPLLYMPQGIRENYSKSFLALCALQHLQGHRESRQLNLSTQKEYNTGLWAIDELVSSIALQTEYHFSQWAIDQPELIFALVFRITRDFVLGVDEVLQPLIDRARLLSYSAKEAWVFAMVQMLAAFLEKKVFSILAERYKEKHMKTETVSSWLHLMDLIIAFDKRMQSLLSSEPGSLEGFSRGVSALSVLCHRPDWLKIWAKIELRDAWKKLKAELKDEKAWSVFELLTDKESDQYLLSTRENNKYPLIAESATKIAWEMIERCRNLPGVLVRNQFIRLSVARFFWYFFNVLLLRCKRTESPCSHLSDDALMRICGSINAARHIESKLQEWSNDVSFLEMRMVETNSSVHELDSFKDDTSFFSDEIASLAELETDWLMKIITDIIFQFESLSRVYFHNKESVEQVDSISVLANMDLAVSSDIIEALEFLRSQLQVMNKFLNPIDFMDLWRSVADGIDHFIFSSILKSNIVFSDEIVKQFGIDMQALFLVFQPFCARPEAFFPCLRDSLKLFKLEKEEVSRLLVDLSNDRRTKALLHCRIQHLFPDRVKEILRMRKFCK